MDNVKIYVEGVNDRVFISDFLKEVLGMQVSIKGMNRNQIFAFSNNRVEGEILVLDGWDKLNTVAVQYEFTENTKEGIKNIILADADTLQNAGGFYVRQAQIDTVKKNNSLSFEYFLMPNNKEDGYLETVLRNILKKENQAVLKCIDDNDDCLRQAQKSVEKDLNLYPLKGAEKSKISYFRRLLNDLTNFQDNTIWDLNHPYLNDLKQFLEQHLT